MTVRPGQAPTRSEGGPITGAALPRADNATTVDRPGPDTVAPPKRAAGVDEAESAATGAVDTGAQRSVDTVMAVPQGPNKLVWAGVALALVGAITAGAAVSLSGNGDDVAQDPEPITTTTNTTTPVDMQPDMQVDMMPVGAGTEEAGDVRLRIVVAPAEASIFLDDVEYPSPLDARLERRQAPSRLRIELAGYESVDEVILLDQDREILRVLERARRGTRMGTPRESATDTPMDSPMTTAMETMTPVMTPEPTNTSMMDGFRETF